MNAIRSTLAGAMLAASASMAAPMNASFAQSADAPESAPASMPGGPHHGGPGHLFDQLGLSADQKTKIDAIMAAGRPAMKNLHEQMHTNSMKLHQMAPDDPNYAATVSLVSAANGSLMSQSITAESDLHAQIYALLTPVQQRQLVALQAQMEAHMKDHKHWGHRPPPDAPN